MLQHTVYFSSREGGGGREGWTERNGEGELGLGHVDYNKKFDFHSLFHAIGCVETLCPMGVS